MEEGKKALLGEEAESGEKEKVEEEEGEEWVTEEWENRSLLPSFFFRPDNRLTLPLLLSSMRWKNFFPPHSPRGATSIELRKAITDNGPNGTHRTEEKSGGRKTKDKDWRERGRGRREVKREREREGG